MTERLSRNTPSYLLRGAAVAVYSTSALLMVALSAYALQTTLAVALWKMTNLREIAFLPFAPALAWAFAGYGVLTIAPHARSMDEALDIALDRLGAGFGWIIGLMGLSVVVCVGTCWILAL